MIETKKLLRVTETDGSGLCSIYVDHDERIVIDYGEYCLCFDAKDWKTVVAFADKQLNDTD